MGLLPGQIRRDIKRTLSTKIGVALEEMHRAIQGTPVYTGRTLVNYRWSVGTPITDTRAPIKNPQLSGKTSTMSIGQEPRRAANQAVIDAEFAEVKKSAISNPFQKFFLTNNVPNFLEIEYGSYSANSRTPAGGMTRRGELMISIIIKGAVRRG